MRPAICRATLALTANFLRYEGVFMGFFSEIIGSAASLILGPVAGGAVSELIGGSNPLITSGQSAVVQAQVATREAGGVANGRLRKRTIVETFDPATGVVTKRDVPMPGAPAVMRSDVVAANRLDRQITNLNKRRKTKLVHPTQAATLKKELELAQLRALRRALESGGGGGTSLVRIDND